MLRWSDVAASISVKDDRLEFWDRAYVLHSGSLVWCVNAFYHCWKQNGATTPIHKFMEVWEGQVAGYRFITPADIRRKQNVPNVDLHLYVPSSTMSTVAVIATFVQMINSNQTNPSLCSLAEVWLTACCQRAFEALESNGVPCNIAVGDVVLIVMPSGEVRGWGSVINLLNESIRKQWLVYSATAGFDKVRLDQLLVWAVKHVGIKTALQRTRGILNEVISGLIEMLQPLVDQYVLGIYSERHSLTELPRILRNPSGRSTGNIDAETAWSVMERARMCARCSVTTILAVKSCDPELLGVSDRNGHKWAGKELNLYADIQHDNFHDLPKYQILADPSGHNGQSTQVGTMFSWEINEAGWCLAQVMPPSTTLTSDDFDLPDSANGVILARKAIRAAAFREWQAISAMRWHFSGKGIDALSIPEAATIRAVSVDEVRVVDESDPAMNRAFLMDSNTGVFRPVLPDDEDPGKWEQATFGLDSGAVGRAGAFFAKHKLKLFMHVVWDKIHRLIRDIKLACEHAANGDLLRALLRMCYVWSLNSKPFGSKAWFEQKKEMMAEWVNTHTSSSSDFRAFAERLALDFKMPLENEDQYSAVFDRVPEMPSFVAAEEPIKPMRWFSANAHFSNEAIEFYALKMVLRHHLGLGGESAEETDYDPAPAGYVDPHKELKALKDDNGGMQLAEQLLTPWLHQHIRLYFFATRASWDWYTYQRTQVKSPAEGLLWLVGLSEGGWHDELHAIFAASFANPDHLQECGLGWGEASTEIAKHQCVVGKLVDFVLHLANNRIFSNMPYEQPPNCYAGLLTGDAGKKNKAMAAMRSHATILYEMDGAAHANPDVAQWLADTSDVWSTAIRVLYATFERDKWSISSKAGRRVLATMLIGLPDTVPVECGHQFIRDLERQNRTSMSTPTARTRAVVDSGILESSGVQHSKVDKTLFVEHFKDPPRKLAWRFKSRRHKMSPSWLEITSRKKDWISPTPESSRSGLASWAWGIKWNALPDEEKVPFGSARFSIMVPFLVLLVKPNGDTVLAFQAQKWGVPVVSLTRVVDPTAEEPWSLWSVSSQVSWCHITDPREWGVLQFKQASPLLLHDHAAGVFPNQILLQGVGEVQSLLRYGLVRFVALTMKELQLLASMMGVDLKGLNSKAKLIKGLAEEVCKAEDEAAQTAYIALVETNSAAKPKPKKVVIDAMTEAALEGMEHGDQKEFGAAKKMIERQNKRRRITVYKADHKKEVARKRKAAPKRAAAMKRPRMTLRGKGRASGGAGDDGSNGHHVGPTPPAEPPVAMIVEGCAHAGTGPGATLVQRVAAVEQAGAVVVGDDDDACVAGAVVGGDAGEAIQPVAAVEPPLVAVVGDAGDACAGLGDKCRWATLAERFNVATAPGGVELIEASASSAGQPAVASVGPDGPPSAAISGGLGSDSAPAPPEPVVAKRKNGKDPTTFDWEAGNMSFHFTKVKRSGGSGWAVTCGYHDPQIPLRSTTGLPRPCTRELSHLESAGADKMLSDDECIRCLKHWCVVCRDAVDRNAHMSLPRVPDVLWDDARLDRELESIARGEE